MIQISAVVRIMAIYSTVVDITELKQVNIPLFELPTKWMMCCGF